MARKASKPAPKVKPAGKYSLTLELDDHLARRFKSFCAFQGRPVSAIAAEMIRDQLRGFMVGYTPPGTPGEPAGPDAPPAGDGEPETIRMTG